MVSPDQYTYLLSDGFVQRGDEGKQVGHPEEEDPDKSDIHLVLPTGILLHLGKLDKIPFNKPNGLTMH